MPIDILGVETQLLTLIVFLPTAGAALLLLLSALSMPETTKNAAARWLALGISLVELVLTIYLFVNYDQARGGFQFEFSDPWFPLIGSSWHLGVDGLSVVLILLSGILAPLAILISFEIEERVPLHMALFLFLQTGLIGVFSSLDLVIFFIFWEIGLVPMYFLINIWGSGNRVYASMKFFLYTMAGSLGLLLSIQLIGLAQTVGSQGARPTMDITQLLTLWPSFTGNGGTLLGMNIETVKNIAFLAFFVAFAIKVPVWPFHTWLPDAHTEAPTAGSMILAGVLLKLGAYGFLRLVIPLFPAQALAFAPAIAILAMLGIILGAFAAYGQNDFKRLVAYSSVNHMGFVVLGVAVLAYVYGTIYTGGGTMTPEQLADAQQSAILATNGAALQMFAHGLSSAGMFLLVGAIYRKAHTRDLREMGGFWVLAPIYGGILIFTSMASLGLPGLAGFVSEFLVVRGAFAIPAFTAITALSMIGLLFTGAYILKAIQKVLHGRPSPEWVDYDKRKHRLEISWRETIAIAPLIALTVITGILPNWILPMLNQVAMRFFGSGG